jgi:hypothetical protein
MAACSAARGEEISGTDHAELRRDFGAPPFVFQCRADVAWSTIRPPGLERAPASGLAPPVGEGVTHEGGDSGGGIRHPAL